jgi:hypothetical protein
MTFSLALRWQHRLLSRPQTRCASTIRSHGFCLAQGKGGCVSLEKSALQPPPGSDAYAASHLHISSLHSSCSFSVVTGYKLIHSPVNFLLVEYDKIIHGRLLCSLQKEYSILDWTTFTSKSGIVSNLRMQYCSGSVNLLAISSVATSLTIMKGRVYERHYNDILESSFILNLCIFSVTILYVREEGSGSQYNLYSCWSCLHNIHWNHQFSCIP